MVGTLGSRFNSRGLSGIPELMPMVTDGPFSARLRATIDLHGPLVVLALRIWWTERQRARGALRGGK